MDQWRIWKWRLRELIARRAHIVLPWNGSSSSELVLRPLLGIMFLTASCGKIAEGRGTQDQLTPASLAQCATSPAAMLGPSDLSGFRTYAAYVMKTSPVLWSKVGNSTPPPAVTHYLRGRFANYVIARAWSPANLAQSHRRERKLGYKLTSTPYLPLEGSIVQNSPGAVLEVGQVNSVFSSASGVANYEYISTLPYLRGGYPNESKVTLGGALKTATVFRLTPFQSTNTPFQETIYQVFIVQNNIQVTIYVQGGSGLPITAVSSLVSKGLKHLKTSCHLKSI